MSLTTGPRGHLVQRLAPVGTGLQVRLQGDGGRYLVDVVEVGALVGPVAVALPDAVLRQRGQHDDDHTAALPHHLQREGQVTRSQGLSLSSTHALSPRSGSARSMNW